MNDKVYSRLRKQFNDIYSVEPTDLGIPWLTKLYKKLSKYIKVFPFRVFVPLSAFFALLIYILFGLLVIRLVSVLQYGF